MSQNKFMHPRNIYRKPPCFKDMAIMYPEFRKFAKPDISGKITLDFKNPEALRALTKTLLLKDFDLQVDIPLTRLIPTLPLRLNYLLWIEDLLDVIGIQRSDYATVSGIDVGTGASCIYPLLAAKQNSWQMIATEVDNESYKIAEANVNTNNLQHLISVRLVEGSKLLKDVLGDKNYTFCMCNPPFFGSEYDLDYSSKSRSPCRPPPHNGTTGDLRELVVPGGEVAFILKMMEESKEIESKIKIYTTMIGHKSSIAVLKLELKKLNVASMTETRFCQGNTTRWGIAWTYDKSYSLQKAYQTPNQKKSNTPMSYIVPQEAVNDEIMYSVENITEKLLDLLTKLQVQCTLKKKNKFMAIIDITAFKNTWSHQRRKKRQGGKLSYSEKSLTTKESSLKEEEVIHFEEKCATLKREHSDTEQNEIAFKKIKIEGNRDLIHTKQDSELCETSLDSNSDVSAKNKQTCTSDVQDVPLEQDTNAIATESTNSETLCAPVAEICVFVRSIASEIHIEFLWKGGTGGRESMHQVLQHVKNKLK